MAEAHFLKMPFDRERIRQFTCIMTLNSVRNRLLAEGWGSSSVPASQAARSRGVAGKVRQGPLLGQHEAEAASHGLARRVLGQDHAHEFVDVVVAKHQSTAARPASVA